MDWNNVVCSDLLRFYNKAQKRIESLKGHSSISEIKNRFNIPITEDISEYLAIPELSNSIWPTKNDIRNVREFAVKMAFFFEGESESDSVFRKINNQIVIKEKSPEKHRERNAKLVSKVHFYSKYNWDHSLPKINLIAFSSDLNNPSIEEIIKIKSINTFKGLESDCVILFINAINKEIIKELYIGTSRAVSYLHIIINRSIFERIYQFSEINFTTP